MDFKTIRNDFPVLSNQNIIYFDSATSSLLPTRVIEEIRKFYETNGTVVKRGAYKLTIESTEQYEKARIKVAEFFNASPAEIVFVPNESYGISSLLYSLPWEKNDRVITSYLEHHSNYLPLLYLASRFSIELDHIAHNSDGKINPDALSPLIKPETKLVSLTYSPLLFGTINPIRPIVKIAHDKDVRVLVDGTRIAGHSPIDLKSLGCDYFVCHGNIGLLGPMGVGILYINQDAQEGLNPLILGSGTVAKVTVENYKLMDFPSKFEPGNPNVADVVGLGGAINYLNGIGLSNIRTHEVKLINLMINRLTEIEKITLYGPTDSSEKNGIISFNIEELNAHDTAMYLDEVANIAVRSGQLCCHPMLDQFNISGVVQASLHLYNSKEEVTQFLDVVETIVKELA
ncbi:MAG: cysteine desulfurase [Candidatus Helarchaeota archaeon]|nr:cysteine desulfurase [Candidatus Helarchaeota archaeon]